MSDVYANYTTSTGQEFAGEFDFEGRTGPIGPKGDKGDKGDSAYEIAVQNGYEGTEEQWSKDFLTPDGYYDKTSVDGLLSKKTYYFNNVAAMKAYRQLKAGDCAITLGYYEPNDGGGAQYVIRNKNSNDIIDNGSIIELNNTLVAELIVKSFVTPEIFGAKGDGTTNDTMAIQNAVNKYNNIKLSKTYLIDSLTVNQELNIFGNGTIKRNSNGTFIATANNLFLNDISIDCNNTNGKAIDTSGDLFINHIVLKNISTENTDTNGQYGIYVHNANSVEIKNSLFKNIYSIGIFSTDCEKFILINNKFSIIGNQAQIREGSAMYVSHSKFATVDNNIFENITDSCIYLNKSSVEEITITNNKIDGCGKEGIKNQTQALRTIISNNIIKNCVNQGIVTSGASQSTNIIGNVIESCCIAGISKGTRYAAVNVFESFNCNVSNNIIKFCDLGNAYGIMISQSSHQLFKSDAISIVNNIIDCTSGIGIWCQGCTNIKINDNLIKNTCLNTTAWKVGIYLSGCKGVVNNNLIPENDFIYGDCQKISSNIIQLPKGFPSIDFTGLEVTVFSRVDVQDTDDESLTTIITGYDNNLKQLTLQDNINFSNPSNELVFKLQNNIKLSFGFRFYKDVDVIISGNNYSAQQSAKFDFPDTITTFPLSTSLTSANKFNSLA